jgi:16S rRNA (cytidine1402-2'-O)-methyltransferase
LKEEKKGKLYIVGTPIGNLSDMTMGGIEVLKSVQLIAAEDTRHTAVLLQHFGITTPMSPYHKFNENASAASFIKVLLSGSDVALVSDAGMPLISDPGSILLQKARENEIEITVVGSNCAALSALILSGLSAECFTFIGFLPDKKKEREEKLLPFLHINSTLIFYSPPQSINKDLDFLHSFFGKRRAALVREISKIHEETVNFSLGETPEITKKGEFVIVVEGQKKVASDKTISELFEEYTLLGLDKMTAIKTVAREKNIAKSEVYKHILDTQN